MANYNIEMNYYNGGSYDTLYPNIPISAVNDWSNNIYNKTQIDGFVSNLNSQISSVTDESDNISSQLGSFKFERVFGGQYNFHTEQGTLLYTFGANYFKNKKAVYIVYLLENSSERELSSFMFQLYGSLRRESDDLLAGFGSFTSSSVYREGIAVSYSIITNSIGFGTYTLNFLNLYQRNGSGSYVYSNTFRLGVTNSIPVYGYYAGYNLDDITLRVSCYLASIT